MERCATLVDLTHIGCDTIEKNICERLVQTLFEKNTIMVKRNMEVEGICQHLWLSWHPHNQHKILKPQAPYMFTRDELNTFLSWMGSLKIFINYGASLTKHVANKKLGSIKTHDYHLLMQQLLPLCLWGFVAVEPWMAIMRLSHVFHWICVKVWNPNEIGSLQKDVTITISFFKKKILPTFFNIMTHLFAACCGWIRNMWARP